jgi:hypothetical protein
MAGFANLIGGMGQAAQQYGAQVRAQLEARRDHFADMIGQAAQTETDPQTRTALLRHQSDLIAGKPIGKIAADFQSTVQKRIQDEQALHSVIGPPPQTPPPQPGAAPGVTPGQPVPPPPDQGSINPTGFTSMIGLPAIAAEQPPAPPVAAQPAGNPVTNVEGGIKEPAPPVTASPAIAAIQNGLRGGGTAAAPLLPSVQPTTPTVATIPNLPVPEDPAQIVRETMSDPRWAAPANRPALLQVMQQRLSHQEALRQAQETQQTTLAYKQYQIAQMKKSPYWDSLPSIVKAQYEAEAGGLQPIQVGSMLRPVNTPGDIPASSLSDADRVDIHGQTIDAKKFPYVREHRDLISGLLYYSPSIGPVQTVAGPNGLTNVARLPGDLTAGGAPAMPVSTLTRMANGGIDGDGHEILFNPFGHGTPVTAPGINPSMMGHETEHTSVTSPEGVNKSSTLTRPVPLAAPGVPAKAGETPIPAAPGTPALHPATGALPSSTIAPFDSSSRLDSIVKQIANGDTTLAKSATNARDKYQIETRMAQLGLDPANITTSMRDRANNARLILDHMKDINGIIDKADKDGDLGVVATRWNDFLTNKLGKDPTKTQVFAKLSSELGFLSTAVSMAHGGLRGGSSPTMVEHWEKALDAKDPQTLRAKLGEATKWMEGYSKLDQGLTKQANGGIQTLPGTKADPDGLRQFVK